jgi:hypothetical protein
MQQIAKKARLNIKQTHSVMQSVYVDTIHSTRVLSQSPDTSILNIGTHDGSFHCDEALAIAMLKFHPDYEGATVIRTRK